MSFSKSERDNGGVDAAGDNHVTDKLSMTSALVPLASNDLFGIAARRSFRLFVVVETMPFAIVAFHENKTVALP